MTESERVYEYRLTQAEKEISALSQRAEREISALSKEIESMKKDAEARERARLKAGIGALGSVVLTLFGILWGYRSVIFK